MVLRERPHCAGRSLPLLEGLTVLPAAVVSRRHLCRSFYVDGRFFSGVDLLMQSLGHMTALDSPF